MIKKIFRLLKKSNLLDDEDIHVINRLHEKKYWRKIFNYIIIQIQYYFQFSIVLGYPYYLCIDPSTFCNLKCPLCAVGRGVFLRKSENMKWDNFKRVIDRLGPYLLQMDIYEHGEPLLNPDVYRMIEYCKKYHITTKMSTNLTTVDPARLVESGLDQLFVALDGTSQETYEKYRVNGSYEKVLSNMIKIVGEKKRLNRKRPLVEWKFIVFKHNEHEIEKAKRLATEIGVDKIVFNGANLNPGNVSEIEKWVSTKSEYCIFEMTGENIKQTRNVSLNKIKNQCNLPWISVDITTDASVKLCCQSTAYEDDCGNINESSFWSIWNSKKYRLARKFINKRMAISDSEFPCKSCGVIGSANISLNSELL